jgi:glycosyltransferase involved in cell wall biosynthesis
MSSEIKISSIIIARDEENSIRRCIQSQTGVVDDIVVVVDSRTTDNTSSAALSFPNVYCETVEWSGYAGTKNYALSKTKYDWILWIDADEEITEGLANELRLFKSEVPTCSAYKIPRRAFFLGKWIKHCGWYPGYVTRLFDKKAASFSANKVHEGLIFSGNTGALKNDLNHYTDPTIGHYFSKFDLYTSLAAEELNERGVKSGLNDLLLRPLFMFMKMYIFRSGFLDGIHGLILSVFSSAYVFTKYCKLWELNKRK